MNLLKGLDMDSNTWQIQIWPVDYKIPSRVKFLNFTLDADLSSFLEVLHPRTEDSTSMTISVVIHWKKPFLQIACSDKKKLQAYWWQVNVGNIMMVTIFGMLWTKKDVGYRFLC